MEHRTSGLRLGCSILALVATSSFAASGALAQVKSDADSAAAAVEEVTVTGTSIKGITPVGSNLVTVGQQQIDATGSVNVQQMLKTVPSLTAMGGSGQGQLPGVSYYSPTIHSLGGSAANSTLVLIDGHRIPLNGIIAHPLADPSIVPTIAIERVEVLAEGASATYGADAVAGVVNFVTRKKYDGLQLNAQYGSGTDYNTLNFSGLFGHAWESGSVLAATTYSYASSVPYDYSARPYLYPDMTSLAAANGLPAGATNNLKFTCNPATIQVNGTGNIFTSASSGTSVANTQANRFCDNQKTGDFVPKEKRTTLMVKLTQDIGSRLTLTSDLDFSYRDTFQRQSRGTLTATAYQTGTQANPFYQVPAGYTGAAPLKETIQWDADALLGPGGASSDNNAETWFQTNSLEFRLSDTFRITASTNIGQDTGFSVSRGKLCGSCATLALNGTTNTSGSLTQISVPNTTQIITQLPLTASNALDVWNPTGSNKTSAATLAMLTDSLSVQKAVEQNTQFRIGADGQLFDLPAGPLRIALGAEAQHFILDTTNTQPGSYGPASLYSRNTYYPFSRSVRSGFLELDIPLISPDMNLPLFRKVDVDLSGRYDSYSDFGNTSNPKIAIDWQVIEGLKFRANWSTAFVAPSPRSEGDPSRDGLNSISSASQATDTVVIPVAAFPGIIGVPGCPAGSVTCTIGTTVPGINRYTGNPNVQPEKGRTWNIGVDWAPEFIEGLSTNITLFNNKIIGGITSPIFANIISSSSLYNKLTFCGAAGCSQAQINAFIGPAPVTSVLAPTTYYLYDRRQGNFLDLNLQGLDYAINYTFDTQRFGHDWGTVELGAAGSQFLRYDQDFAGGTVFSVLNTTGYNVTYPSIAQQVRFNLDWDYKNYGLDLFLNWIGSYRDYSATTLIPVTTSASGAPNGGGDPVRSSVTVDAHFSYKFDDSIGWNMLGGTEVYVDVRNLFDQTPEFINGTGYDPYGGNPLGRVVSVGMRMKL